MKGGVYRMLTNKRPPIHHRRVEEQETSRTDIPHQGQPASV